MLAWVTVTSSQAPRFLVKGTELSKAIVPGTGHRFQLCEVRTVERNELGVPYYDRTYQVRDAHTVSDAEVREGIRPRIVGHFDDLDQAVAWCLEQVK